MKAEQGMRYEILDQGGAAAKSAFGSIAEVGQRPAGAGYDANDPISDFASVCQRMKKRRRMPGRLARRL